MKLFNYRYNQLLKPLAMLSLFVTLAMANTWAQDYEVFEDVEILEEPLDVVEEVMPRRAKRKVRRALRRNDRQVRRKKRVVRRRPILEEEDVQAVKELQQDDSANFQDSYSRDGSTNNNRNHGGVQIVKVEATSDNKNGQVMDNAVEVDSFAGMYRNERRHYEARNNSRIIEKLEMDRIRNEKTLEDKIEDFGGAIIGPSYQTEVEVEKVIVAPSHHSKYTVNPFSKWSISPVFGYRSKDGGYYDVESGFMFGVAMEGNITKNFSFEAGINYSSHEISCSNQNNNNQWNHGWNNNWGNTCDYRARSMSTYDINANVKASFGNDYNFWKPYGLIGLGMTHTEYDIDTQAVNNNAAANGWERATDNTTINVGAGIDYVASANMNIGIRYTYQMFLSDASSGMDDFYGDSNATSTFSGSATFKF